MSTNVASSLECSALAGDELTNDVSDVDRGKSLGGSREAHCSRSIVRMRNVRSTLGIFALLIVGCGGRVLDSGADGVSSDGGPTTSFDASAGDAGPSSEAGEPGDAIAPSDAPISPCAVSGPPYVPPPVPKVTLVSGSCAMAVPPSCDTNGRACTGGGCLGGCNSCWCQPDGKMACSPNICAASGCPLRLPTHGTTCGGDCACEFESSCAGAPHHRAVCVSGKWQVTYAPCAPSCPTGLPTAGAECWTEMLGCTYPRAGFSPVRATCMHGRWQVVAPACDAPIGSSCRAPCPKECPTTAPVSGESCSVPTPVGIACGYTGVSAGETGCFCSKDLRWSCYDSETDKGMTPPGSELSPYRGCMNQSWCPGVGGCCGTSGPGSWACTCTSSGYVCATTGRCG